MYIFSYNFLLIDNLNPTNHHKKMEIETFKVYWRNPDQYFLFTFYGNELQKFENVNFKIKSWDVFLQIFPTTKDKISNFTDQGFNVEAEIPDKITFDKFWAKYNYKVQKTQAEKIWDKLSVEKRKLYYDWVDAYFTFLKDKYYSGDWTAFKKLAKTYLSKQNEPWEDEEIRKFYKPRK